MSRSYTLLNILALSSLFCACQHAAVVRPNTKGLTTPPATWQTASQNTHNAIATGWLHDFRSPQMTRIVQEAINRNPNLNAAAERLRAAKLDTVASQARFLPSISASTSTSRSFRLNGPNAASSSGRSYGLSLGASWEPDLWGRLHNLRNADLAGYQASVEDYRAARLSLAANTAKAYLNLTTAQNLLALAERTRTSFQQNLSIIERNYKAGVPGTRAIDLQLSRNNVSNAERSIQQRKLQIREAARELETLLGHYPAAAMTANPQLPKLSASIPTGIPAQLLSRRPDLRSRELNIIQSAQLADAACKSLLPNLSLNGSLSNGSDRRLIDLLNPQYLAASAAASLSQTVYRGGELQANAQAALHRQRATIYDYVNAAQSAFKEVEAALDTEASLAKQEAHLLREIKQASSAERTAEVDYSEGIESSGILEILESQRRANNARAALINLRNQRLRNRIDLHLALGGDFEHQNP